MLGRADMDVGRLSERRDHNLLAAARIDSKGLSRALRSLVKFTGKENPPKSSSKKSRDSELD